MYTKLAIALLILLLGLGGGWYIRKGVDSAKREQLTTELAKASNSLFQAEAVLRQDAATFRAINTQTKANVAAAEAAAASAKAQALAAQQDKKKSDQALAGLQAKLAKEKETCPAGRALICGVPLR